MALSVTTTTATALVISRLDYCNMNYFDRLCEQLSGKRNYPISSFILINITILIPTLASFQIVNTVQDTWAYLSTKHFQKC